MRIKTGSIRVSSTEQKEQGNMIAVYRSDMLRHGVAKENIFEELARSGSMDEDKDINFKVKDGKLIMEFDLRRKRPMVYDWLINEVLQDKVSEHYITTWSRLARNIPLALGLIYLCKQHGTKVIATADTNDEKSVLFVLTMAHLESMFTKERVDMNKEFKFANGLYTGTQRLWGYQKTTIEINGRKFQHLIPLDSEKKMILDIFSDLDYKQVCSTYSIDPKTYYNIRKNRFYCGYIEYNKIEKKGIHMPIITEEQWKRVNP